MTKTIRVDRLAASDLRAWISENYQPAGVSLWWLHVSEALASDDRLAAFEAILASAPLSEDDVHYLCGVYDEGAKVAGAHAAVAFDGAAPGEETETAARQLLYAGARSLLDSGFSRYVV